MEQAATPDISHYTPQFLWKFWLSNVDQVSKTFRDSRIHIYDVYDNELTETRRIPKASRAIFQDLNTDVNDSGWCDVLQEAQDAFDRLERDTELLLDDLCKRMSLSDETHRNAQLTVSIEGLDTLRRYFAFLRFRNSAAYASVVHALRESKDSRKDSMASVHQHFVLRFRRRAVVRGLIAFLSPAVPTAGSANLPSDHPDADALLPLCQDGIRKYCWRFSEAEVCLGLAAEGEGFLLTDTCFGTLDESFGEDGECGDVFFPIIPNVALYLIATDSSIITRNLHRSNEQMAIDCGFESSVDVHLRNGMILQTYPRYLYFSSLRSVAQSVSSYGEFRKSPEHLDYSRLRQRCRQKYTQEGVTKTLVVKDSVVVTDLTDEVKCMGSTAVAYGSFSDVWKGVWTIPTENTTKMVALKFLRQIMVHNVREKLLKRLKDEVIAWHRLQHPNIAALYGVVQSMNTIGMVSAWCENGTVSHYLKENPCVDRLQLLIQISSGVSYLHNYKPVVVHGDLKGGNILIDGGGNAVITDFGLSKVLEDISDSMNLPTSFFAGSTRWMAVELVLALVEDDGRPPPITTRSDVYAFAAVCLEIVTGQVPYAHRSNDHAVTVDIMRGVKPTRGASCHAEERYGAPFWEMLDRCWDDIPDVRPSMSDMNAFLVAMAGSCS